MRNARRIAAVAALAVILAAAVPALSAAARGSIEHASLAPGQSLSGVAEVRWNWQGGSAVNSLDTVNVYVSTGGPTWAETSWTKVASRVPIRDGIATWDTAATPDSSYIVRLKVHAKPASAYVSPVVVDNTAPEVAITQPSQGQIIVDDETPDFALVAGTVTLKADALDDGSGLSDVSWYLNDGEEPIATGTVAEHSFNDNPGQHVLSVVATDHAGNTSSDAITIIAVPASSALAELAPPELPEQELPELPEVPGEGDLPTLPGEGDLPGLPGEGDLPTLPGEGDLPPAPGEGDLPGAPDPNDPPEQPALPDPGPLPTP